MLKLFFSLALLFSLAFIPNSAFSQPTIEWQRAFGGSNMDVVGDVQQTADGGYIFIGSTKSADGDVVISTPHGNRDVWVVKLTAAGQIDWQRNYGGDSSDLGIAIAQTADGGYFFAASSGSSNGDKKFNTGNNPNNDFWLVRLTDKGDIKWEKSYGTLFADQLNDMIITKDGGCIMVGSTESNMTDIYAVKVDDTGMVIWQKSFGGSSSDAANSVIELNNGDFVMAGNSYSKTGDIHANYGASDFCLLKTDALGNIKLQKNYGGTDVDLAFSVSPSLYGGYILAGRSLSTDNDVTAPKGTADFFIVKVDSNGGKTWVKNIGGTAADGGGVCHIIQEEYGNYILIGTSASVDGDIGKNNGGNDIFVSALYPDGSLRWKLTMGGTADDNGLKVRKTKDGGYIMCGTTLSSDGDAATIGHHGMTDVWVVKLSSTNDVNVLTKDDKVAVYPTITNNTVFIDLADELKGADIKIVNLNGQYINTPIEVTGSKRKVHFNNVPGGVYLLYVTGNKETSVYKIEYIP